MAKRVFTVLCIDGGGVRGIIPAKLLQEIEKRTGKPIAECFDMVSGSSTGAILAAGLTAPDPKNPKKPKLAAADLLNLYLNHSPEIFPNSRYKQLLHLVPGANGFYDAKPLEDALLRSMGDVRLKDALTHILIPATDIKKYRPVWIKHLKGQKDPEHWGSMYLRDAVRASATPPTIFPVKYVHTYPNDNVPSVKERHAFIDGTFFAGNMSRRAYVEAKKIAPPDAEIVVLYLGTGYTAASNTPDEFNKKSLLDLVTTKSDGPSILSMSLSMFTTDVNNALKDEIGERMFEWDKQINTTKPEQDPSDSIVDSTESNLESLVKFADGMIEDLDGDIDRLCDIIKTRSFEENAHIKSKAALLDLRAELKTAPSLKKMTKLYNKIVQFSSDLHDSTTIADADQAIYEHAQNLSDRHKTQLDRFYKAMKDELRTDLTETFKRWSNYLTKPFRKKGKPANDNQKQLPNVKPDNKKSFGPKR